MLQTATIMGVEKTFEPAHDIMGLTTKATSEGSGELAHVCSLARAFAVCTNEVW